MLSINQAILQTAEKSATKKLSWQEQLVNGFKNPHELLVYLQLSPASVNLSELAHQAFKTRVPRAFATRMGPGNIHDPLLKQVLPIADEMQEISGYFIDPLQEKEHNPVPGLLHKYAHRVLLTLTAGCAINCRYCFRRHFDYQNNTPGRPGLPAMLEYIRSQKDIKEVIFSGGDPLLVSDDILETTIQQIAEIESVEILRIHTRMPIVLPDRVTCKLLEILQKTRLEVVCVVHCNHPNELDDSVRIKITELRDANIHVLNQSVLLKGVNDSVETLCQLSHGLFKAGILPYYLHVLDKVQGAAHFDIDEQNALNIHENMRKSLPGYLLPRLVREIPGELSKMPVKRTHY